MGLADRFKNELDKREFISEEVKNTNPFMEELKAETVNKINKTPYWDDYSSKSKEKMISKYFDVKLYRANIVFTQNEKTNFIKSILDIIH